MTRIDRTGEAQAPEAAASGKASGLSGRAADDQRETIAFLSRPESYGTSEPVKRIDTHSAIVFLAGDRAYKLKRAVRYNYLDFSTVARRRAVCEDELRLNRRTAPDLYLEVRSINRQTPGSLGFGPGEPVDWLVVMRRFGDDCLLDQVAARGGLAPTLVRALADSIARFHDQAERANVADGAARVHAVIDGNRNSMAALSHGLPAADVERLHALSLSAFRRVAPLLDRRATEGCVRRCHGDLHLANVCLWNGRPTLFDCLEFSEELARIDVLYDLAFLLMDLWERGYRAQASQLFNRYFDTRDEGDGVAALPLFISMRAAVRAHVDAAAAERNTAERAQLQRRSLDYLASASAFLAAAPPRLLAIGGLSGSGKSTLAQEVAPALAHVPGARVIRSDVLRKRMMRVLPESRLGAEAYTSERNAEVYSALCAHARAMLTSGRTAIADAVFAHPEERKAIARVAHDLGVPFTGIWLEAAPSVLRARVEARSNDASDATSAIVDRQLGYAFGDLGDWHVLDGSADLVGLALRAKAIIDAPA